MSVSIGIDNVVKKYGDTTIIPDLSACQDSLYE